jgi:hypothetical protein
LSMALGRRPARSSTRVPGNYPDLEPINRWYRRPLNPCFHPHRKAVKPRSSDRR